MNPDSVRAVDRVAHGSTDTPAVLDFSANTNPEVPAGVEDSYRGAFEMARSYPAEPPTEYRRAAAAFVGCEPAQVIPAPGGLAAIRQTIEVSVESGDSVLLPAPSFAEYEREVRLQGAEPVFVPAGEILDAAPETHALAIVCNPNNPTGRLYDGLESFAARCRAANTTLLVDEAFLGFTDQPSIAGRSGVVVARSLTKLFGLPGIRAGYAVATGELRDALLCARRTWNLSGPALATGVHCLDQQEFVERTRDRVRSERRRLVAELEDSFDVHPSRAPFLLLDCGERAVEDVLETARERGLALRDARSFRGLDSHVRVAVRLPAENDRLLEVLADV